VTLTATASAGSTFAGWSGGGCSGTGTCAVTLNSDTTVTATFNAVPVTRTLTVSRAGSGSGGVTSSPAGIDCGSTCSGTFDQGTPVTLTATASAGSTFAGWSGGGCSGTGTCAVTLNSDTTVTATFNHVAPPPPHTMCVVPKLKGKKLGAARKAIKKAHCSVGKIAKVKSSRKNKGRVVSQKPKPGKHLKKSAKVSLKVGR
jgi:PASTA domain/Divergent InlB B-repeat domain